MARWGNNLDSPHFSEPESLPQDVQASPLERLPPEIVQPIWVLSLNLDLPFASPLLFAKIFSNTARRFFLEAAVEMLILKWYYSRPSSDLECVFSSQTTGSDFRLGGDRQLAGSCNFALDDVLRCKHFNDGFWGALKETAARILDIPLTALVPSLDMERRVCIPESWIERLHYMPASQSTATAIRDFQKALAVLPDQDLAKEQMCLALRLGRGTTFSTILEISKWEARHWESRRSSLPETRDDYRYLSAQISPELLETAMQKMPQAAEIFFERICSEIHTPTLYAGGCWLVHVSFTELSSRSHPLLCGWIKENMILVTMRDMNLYDLPDDGITIPDCSIYRTKDYLSFAQNNYITAEDSSLSQTLLEVSKGECVIEWMCESVVKGRPVSSSCTSDENRTLDENRTSDAKSRSDEKPDPETKTCSDSTSISGSEPLSKSMAESQSAGIFRGLKQFQAKLFGKT